MIHPNTTKHIAIAFGNLAETFGQEWSAIKTKNLYHAFKNELEQTCLESLTAEIIRNYKFMPRPSELGEILEKVGKRPDFAAKEDLDRVLTLCEAHGEEFRDFATQYSCFVFQTLMGQSRASEALEKINEKYWDWCLTIEQYRINYKKGRFNLLPKPNPDTEKKPLK